jgi:hypothetical protein
MEDGATDTILKQYHTRTIAAMFDFIRIVGFKEKILIFWDQTWHNLHN